jgi:hypothetical protein
MTSSKMDKMNRTAGARESSDSERRIINRWNANLGERERDIKRRKTQNKQRQKQEQGSGCDTSVSRWSRI